MFFAKLHLLIVYTVVRQRNRGEMTESIPDICADHFWL